MKDRTVPHLVRVVEQGNSSVFLRPDGSLQRKVYDPDGRGAGSSPVGWFGRLLLRREIARAVREARMAVTIA